MDGQCLKNCLWAILIGLKKHFNVIEILWKLSMKISIKDIFVKLMFNILKYYMTFTMNYHLYLKEWKFKKLEKLCPTCLIKKYRHIRNLKQALNHGLALKKIHRIIKFYQISWLKLYIDMNTELRKKMQKIILEKIISNWWMMQLLEKPWKNVRNYRDINLITNEARKNY